MKKYFINCGGHDGCSARWFRDVIDKKCEYYIYTFEPDPRFWRSYQDLEKHTLYKKVVWIRDGKIKFYLSDTPLGNGSSVIKEKRTGNLDKDNPITLRCIDFSQWVKKHFTPEDYIFIKMDIEGAETEVLKKMMEDKTLSYIDKLSVSFHYNKIGVMNAAKNKENIEFVKELEKHLSCPVEKWMFGQYSKYSNK